MDFTEVVEVEAEDLKFFLHEPAQLYVTDEASCNMESELVSNKLANFSFKEKDFISINRINSLHDTEGELVDQFLEYKAKEVEA